MKKKQLSLLFVTLGMLLFSFCNASAQDRRIPPLDSVQNPDGTAQDSIVVGRPGPDLKYREDQFYVGLTFNLLDKMPKGVSQSGFSGGIHAGFIRDFPFNKQRNIGVGLGVGWSINTYRTNLLISKNDRGQSIFQVLDRNDYDYNVNRFATQLIEVPIQLRWRSSTANTYKFWRVYAGVRLGYIYYFQSKFKQPDNKIYQTKVDGLEPWRYGVTFTFGYNTFNFSVYYSLNSLFNGVKTLEGKPVEIDMFKVGLEFYIL